MLFKLVIIIYSGEIHGVSWPFTDSRWDANVYSPRMSRSRCRATQIEIDRYLLA